MLRARTYNQDRLGDAKAFAFLLARNWHERTFAAAVNKVSVSMPPLVLPLPPHIGQHRFDLCTNVLVNVLIASENALDTTLRASNAAIDQDNFEVFELAISSWRGTALLSGNTANNTCAVRKQRHIRSPQRCYSKQPLPCSPSFCPEASKPSSVGKGQSAPPCRGHASHV